MQKNTNIVKNSIVLGIVAFVAVFYGVLFFGASQAEAAYCPFSPAANRTIVNFNASIIWGRGTDRTQSTANVNLPAGQYRVNLSASDGYDGRQDANQSNESYYVELYNGSTLLTQSGMTPDLADRTRYAQWGGEVSTISVTSGVTKIVAKHSNYRRTGSGTDSLDLGCVAFDLISTPAPTLNATCSVSPTSANINTNVSWGVTASGGTGSYTYSWSGDESLTGNGTSVSKSYSSVGTKTGTVTVTSGAQSVVRNCSVVINPPTANLSGSCSVNPSSVALGGYLNWSSTASGGSGSYTYSWSGSDSLTGNASAVSKSYQSAGTKTGTVTITSAGQSVSYTCSGVVNENVNNNLNVSCDVSDSSVDVDEDVTWRASASGGSGSYSYSWNGSNGLSGSSRNVTWSYSSKGTKNATVTVSSGGQSASASCSVRVREVEDDLDVSCYANPSNPQVGQQMNWYANVSGGDGDYDYDWSGSDGLNSSSRAPSMTYFNGGSKNARVRVESNGQTASATCYANVNQNTVLAFSQSNPAPLDGAVYLSEVPYTGAADNLKLAWFTLALMLFSAYVAYVIQSYKKQASGN